MPETFELKRISESSIPAALDRAERYRVLNEPLDAESICRDVLAIDPENQQALAILILALTDQFERRAVRCRPAAEEFLKQLRGEYEREYYAGIVFERQGKAIFRGGMPSAGSIAYDWVRRAMDCYERAERLRPAGNDEAVLRWNTCARLILDNPSIRAEVPDSTPNQLE